LSVRPSKQHGNVLKGWQSARNTTRIELSQLILDFIELLEVNGYM